jgi:uncharacterized protein
VGGGGKTPSTFTHAATWFLRRMIGAMTLPLILLTILTATTAATDSAPSGPTVDCAKATRPVAKRICADAALTALDRKMAATLEKARKAWPDGERSRQEERQLSWVQEREACEKDEDVRGCLEGRYKERIVELELLAGLVPAPTLEPVVFACTGGDHETLTAVFHNETDPPSAVMTHGGARIVAFIAPAASGARYVASRFEFWEHQGEAAVDWFGRKLTCRPR